jgi:putative Ca2+/H+ antiporter (TMEM165/GDT1 family)
LSALAVAFGVVFLAELGDKSQLIALSLAATSPAVALAVLAGARLLTSLPVPVVRRATAVLLAAIGVVLLLGAR